jgi:ferredoxin
MSDQASGTNDWGVFLTESIAADTSDSLAKPVAPARRARPLLSAEAAAPEAEQRAYWAELRAFFRHGTGGGLPGAEDSGPCASLLLHPYVDKPYRHEQFPAWLAEDGSELLPLHRFLQQALDAAAAGGETRILHDNLGRLEWGIIEKLRQAEGLFKARPLITEAVGELRERLAIKGAEGEAFAQSLARFQQALPAEGWLTPYSPHAALHLLAHGLQQVYQPRRRAMLAKTQALLGQLEGLLAVDRAKGSASKSPEHLREELGFAAELLDFGQMSALLPTSGSEPLPAERRAHIEEIVASLREAAAAWAETRPVMLLDAGIEAGLDFDFRQHFPQALLQSAAPGAACAAAMEAFLRQAAQAAGWFSALRRGELEYQGHYRPEVHDDFFAHFDWRSFTDEEMTACPPVLLMAEAGGLLEAALGDFVRLLSSGQPIKVVLLAGASQSSQSHPSPLTLHPFTSAFRPEPGALAVASRNVFSFQGIGVHLEAIADAWRESLAVPVPALLHLLLPDPGDRNLLGAIAAAEGREFPGFSYDCRKGPQWGSRFDIQHNPQPAAGWPQHGVEVENEAGEKRSVEVFFTPADYAVLNPAWAEHFLLVPPRYWSDNLVPLADYLELAPADAYGKVPFIWLVDARQQLHKAAVSWALALISQARLDFWRYLQENAGIHSYHAELAREQARREAQAEAEQRIADLQAAHQRELEEVRTAAARQAIENLADALLDLNLITTGLSDGSEHSALLPDQVEKAVPSKQESASAPAASSLKAEEERMATSSPATAEGAPAAAEPAATLPLGEAWIETPLCTSCNECTELNNQIFKYNSEKQAYVADPKGGPFADIVSAAEKCPAHIIHPGAPQDPTEPGLEELIKRAAPYN